MQTGANFRADDLARTPTLGAQVNLREAGSYQSLSKQSSHLPQPSPSPPTLPLPEPLKKQINSQTVLTTNEEGQSQAVAVDFMRPTTPRVERKKSENTISTLKISDVAYLREQTCSDTESPNKQNPNQQESAGCSVHSGTDSSNATPKSQRRLCFKDFKVCSVLGEGAYGKVYSVLKRNTQGSCCSGFAALAYEYDQRKYALKVIDKRHVSLNDKIHEVHTEKSVLNNLRSPWIVKFFSTFQDEAKLYFLLEQMPNGSLQDFLQREQLVSKRLAQHWAAEIVEALSYLKSKGIIHRDLKPGNILLDADYHIKLIDFATARVENPEIAAKIPPRKHKHNSNRRDTVDSIGNSRHYSLVGTEEYVSPEAVAGNTEETFSADLWSLGVILYQFFMGRTPFKGSSELYTFENIIQNNLNFPKAGEKEVPPEAADLIKRLLVIDPTQRLGAQDMQDLKAHPFFTGIDFQSVRQTLVPVNRKNIVKSPHRNLSPMSSEDVKTSGFFASVLQINLMPQLEYGAQKPHLPHKHSDDTIEEEADLKKNSSQIEPETVQVLDNQYDLKRSSSCNDSGSIVKVTKPSADGVKVVLIQAILKKKGLIFFNNRIVKIDSKGVLTYSDPSNPQATKAKIKLTDKSVRVRFQYSQKKEDSMEVFSKGQSYLFKTTEKHKSLVEQMEQCISKFTDAIVRV